MKLKRCWRANYLSLIFYKSFLFCTAFTEDVRERCNNDHSYNMIGRKLVFIFFLTAQYQMCLERPTYGIISVKSIATHSKIGKLANRKQKIRLQQNTKKVICCQSRQSYHLLSFGNHNAQYLRIRSEHRHNESFSGYDLLMIMKCSFWDVIYATI